MRRTEPQRAMTQNHPISMRAPHHAAERQGRRLSLAAVTVALTLCLAFIAWKLWVVETLRDRLEALSVEVKAVAPLDASVGELRVVGHQGPGESAYFDLIVQLDVRRGPGDGVAVVLVDAALTDHEGKHLLDLEPMALAGMRAGEERIAELVWSPVPKPVAKRADRLLIWAR